MPTPAKKAAKKAAPRSPKAEERTERNHERFDSLRARAQGMGLAATGETPEFPPYTISADKILDGIDEDIVFRRPTNLRDRINLTRMISAFGRLIEDKRQEEALAMFPDILISLSSGAVLDRILRALSSEPDGDALLFALGVEVLEHFSGKGAVDVPGGTRAS